MSPSLALERWLGNGLSHIGEVGRLTFETSKRFFSEALPWREIVTQIDAIGVHSLLIVLLTAIFSSLVMTVQSIVQLARFGSEEYVGSVVALSLVRELGPVLTALMVGGRVGAGIAAELGSMNVTEQVDALRSLGADPIQKLVVPRVIALVMSLPLLTMLANILGVSGALILASFDTKTHLAYFVSLSLQSLKLSDLMGGLFKTLFFGFFISIIACQQGLTTRGGTEGVGRSTTRTVVITSIVTLISDFALTSILLQFGF